MGAEHPDIKQSEDEAINKAAAAFVQARESRSSFNRKSPLDWVEEAKPYLTDAAYKKIKGEINPDGSTGSEWNTAHSEGLGIKSNVSECGVPEAAGVDDDKMRLIQCAVTNTVVGKDGKQVPVTKIPADWINVGPQTATVLVFVKQDGKWLIDQDVTGMGS